MLAGAGVVGVLAGAGVVGVLAGAGVVAGAAGDTGTPHDPADNTPIVCPSAVGSDTDFGAGFETFSHPGENVDPPVTSHDAP